MVILVPLEAGRTHARPLERLNIASYFGSALMRGGKDPFAVSTGHWQPAAADHAKRHSTSPIPNRASQRIGSPIDRRDVSTNTTD